MEQLPRIEVQPMHARERPLTEEQTRILTWLKESLDGKHPEDREMVITPETLTKTFLKGIGELQLPFEIGITEKEGVVSLKLGSNDEEGHPSAGSDEHIESRVSLHSHIGMSFNDICPSPGDLHVLGLKRLYAGQNIPAVIFNNKAVLVFAFDPEFKKREEQENIPGKYSWGLNNRCAFKFEEIQGKIRRKELDLDQGLLEFLQYLKEQGIIKLHKHWEEFEDADLEFLFKALSHQKP